MMLGQGGLGAGSGVLGSRWMQEHTVRVTGVVLRQDAPDEYHGGRYQKVS